MLGLLGTTAQPCPGDGGAFGALGDALQEPHLEGEALAEPFAPCHAEQ
ncbi:MAG: hypothetical protein NZ741_13810 [Armatimonadetes bacterium]|nr:hypothetical protein [Armatimonadota bacterium]